MTSAPQLVTAMVRSRLTGYPHLSSCAACLAYADGLDDDPGLDATGPGVWRAVAAVLGFHESGHRDDPLLVACDHFA